MQHSEQKRCPQGQVKIFGATCLTQQSYLPCLTQSEWSGALLVAVSLAVALFQKLQMGLVVLTWLISEGSPCLGFRANLLKLLPEVLLALLIESWVRQVALKILTCLRNYYFQYFVNCMAGWGTWSEVLPLDVSTTTLRSAKGTSSFEVESLGCPLTRPNCWTTGLAVMVTTGTSWWPDTVRVSVSIWQ